MAKWFHDALARTGTKGEDRQIAWTTEGTLREKAIRVEERIGVLPKIRMPVRDIGTHHNNPACWNRMASQLIRLYRPLAGNGPGSEDRSRRHFF